MYLNAVRRDPVVQSRTRHASVMGGLNFTLVLTIFDTFFVFLFVCVFFVRFLQVLGTKRSSVSCFAIDDSFLFQIFCCFWPDWCHETRGIRRNISFSPCTDVGAVQSPDLLLPIFTSTPVAQNLLGNLVLHSLATWTRAILMHHMHWFFFAARFRLWALTLLIGHLAPQSFRHLRALSLFSFFAYFFYSVRTVTFCSARTSNLPCYTQLFYLVCVPIWQKLKKGA